MEMEKEMAKELAKEMEMDLVIGKTDVEEKYRRQVFAIIEQSFHVYTTDANSTVSSGYDGIVTIIAKYLFPNKIDEYMQTQIMYNNNDCVCCCRCFKHCGVYSMSDAICCKKYSNAVINKLTEYEIAFRFVPVFECESSLCLYGIFFSVVFQWLGACVVYIGPIIWSYVLQWSFFDDFIIIKWILVTVLTVLCYIVGMWLLLCVVNAIKIRHENILIFNVQTDEVYKIDYGCRLGCCCCCIKPRYEYLTKFDFDNNKNNQLQVELKARVDGWQTTETTQRGMGNEQTDVTNHIQVFIQDNIFWFYAQYQSSSYRKSITHFVEQLNYWYSTYYLQIKYNTLPLYELDRIEMKKEMMILSVNDNN